MADGVNIPVILDLNVDFKSTPYEKEVKTISTNLRGLQKQISDIANYMGNMEPTKLNKNFINNAERYIQAARRFADAQRAYQEASNSWRTSWDEKAKKLSNYMEAARKFELAAKSMYSDPLSGQYKAQAQEVEKLSAQLDKLREKSKIMAITGDSDKNWEKVNAEAARLKARIYEITNAMSKSVKNGDAFNFEQSNEEVQQVLATIKTIRAEAKNTASAINSRTTANTGVYTEAYKNQLAEVAKLGERIDNLREKYRMLLATGKATPEALTKMRYELSVIQQEAEDARIRLAGMVEAGDAFKVGRGDTSTELMNIDSIIGQIIGDAQGLSAETEKNDNQLSSILNVVSLIGGKVGAIIRVVSRIYSVVNKVTSTITRAINKVTKGIRSITKGLTSSIGKFGLFRKSGSSALTDISNGFNKLKRNILMYGFGFRTAYFAIKRLRNIFIDAFKTMAAQIPSINKQLNSFTMALNKLKGSLGTMFQPIISVAIPVLVTLMNYLSRAMEMVASFFAVLTGQKVIFKATSNQEDYAASLNDTANAENNARKAHEKRLASYDKLDVIPQDKNTGSGSGSANAPDYPINVTYEPADIEDAISKFAEMVKAAWAKADFTEVGKYLTDKILGILEYVRVQIVPKITDFINRLASSIVTFVDGFDASAIGSKVAEIVNNLIEQLDADQIGRAVASVYNVIIQAMNGFVSDIDWTELGNKLAAGLTGFIDQLDVNTVVLNVTTFINGVLDGVVAFAETMDWEKLAEKISSALETLFTNLDVVGITLTLTDTLFNIIDKTLGSLQEHLESSDNPILSTIGTLIGAIRESLQLLAPIVKQVIQAVQPVVSAILPAIRALSPIISAIVAIITKFVSQKATLLVQFIQQIMPLITRAVEDLLPILQSILEDMDPIFNQITQNWLPDIFSGLDSLEPVIDGIMEILDITVDLMGDMLPVLMEVLDDIVNPLIDLLPVLLRFIGNMLLLLAPILNLALQLLPIGLKFINACLKPIGEILKVVNVALDVLLTIITALYTAAEVFVIPILQVVITVLEVMADWVQNVYTIVSEKIQSTVDDIRNAWTEIKGILNVGITYAETFLNNLIIGVNNLIKALNSIEFKIPDWVPGVGGKGFNINLKEVRQMKLPRLAQGAVLPPNKEFLAVLGDQSHGTNIEAPLDTIKQALIEAMRENRTAVNNQPITLQLDGKTVAKVVWSENEKRYKQTGKYVPYTT